jgi:hypothetical protein
MTTHALHNSREFFFFQIVNFFVICNGAMRFLEDDEVLMIIYCDQNILSIKCYF